MARFGITRPLDAAADPKHIYQKAQEVFKQLGWEVYKLREIAFLVEARQTGPEGYVLANIIVSVFGVSEIKLTLKSDTASQETVERDAAQIMAALEAAAGLA